ncbi:phage regulatory protein/antirepressor Ant [Ignatzschineria cameli]|uniref:Phage regulatory protein/antirepressor Ant n=3 Tax=Ignatzschineria cameli TaxID=2182793 RepID=A0A2U2AQI3_9GAMM|nr:phage regulatory protein/antirepressor Ant [Ignatzschineria cameli]
MVVEQSVDNFGRKRFTDVLIFSGEVGKRDSIVVVARLSPEFTARIVDRWLELESQSSLPALPNFNNPAEAARAWADQVEANQLAQQKLVEVAPKVEFVDRYVKGNGLMTFRQVCKLLNVKEAEFRSFLVSQKIMYRLNGGWAAYQVHLSAGRFQHKAGIAENGRAFSNILFTTKGVNWVAEQWRVFNEQEEMA